MSFRFFLLVLSGCLLAASPPALAGRVILVGIDGADWRIIEPLVKAGKLPGFARLQKEGTTGPLRAFEPLLSPLLWTSISTGRLPEDHGILDFLTTDPATGQQVPAMSTQRRVPAIWNLASSAGKLTAVSGWIATWPPEQIKGFLVSDRAAYHAFIGQGVREKTKPPDDLCFPMSLWAEMQPSLLSRLERAPKLFPGAPVSSDTVKTPWDWVDAFQRSDLLYYEAFTYLREKATLDLAMVYLSGLDGTCHLFMPFTPPRQAAVSKEEFQEKEAVVNTYLIWVDSLLARLEKDRKSDETLIVVSDHGFRSGDERLAETQPSPLTAPRWHRTDGVFAMVGPNVKRRFPLEEASVLDVTPTILALMGLPALDTMPGKVLTEAFQPNSAPANPPPREKEPPWRSAVVATPQPGPPGAEGQELREKLATLGYVTPLSAAALNHEGLRLMETGQIGRAIESFETALKVDSRYPGTTVNLAEALLRGGRVKEALMVLNSALANPARTEKASILGEMAVCLAAVGDKENARKIGVECLDLHPKDALLLINVGNALADSGAPEKAVEALEEASKLGPDQRESAENNLTRLLLRMGQTQEAGKHLQLLLQTPSPGTITVMTEGIFLAETGQLEKAKEAFLRAVNQSPGNPMAWENLGITAGKLKDLKLATEALEKAVSLAPEMTTAKALLAKLRAGPPSSEPQGTKVSLDAPYILVVFRTKTLASAFVKAVRGGKDFIAAGREARDQGSIVTTLLLDTVDPEQYNPEIVKAVKSLEVGTISDPLALTGGFGVVRRMK